MTANRERGGGGAPPPRTPSGVRVVAVVVLTAAAAVVAILSRGGRTQAPTLREAPFEFAHPDVDPRGGAVLLYVSDSCPWCRVELQAWDSLLSTAKPGVRTPTVIMAPGAHPRWRETLPARLAEGALLDADRSLARAMGVGAVPFRARVAPSGRVVDLGAGLSSPAQRLALLSFLNRFSHPVLEVP